MNKRWPKITKITKMEKREKRKGENKGSPKKRKKDNLEEAAINFIEGMKKEQDALRKLTGINCENN